MEKKASKKIFKRPGDKKAEVKKTPAKSFDKKPNIRKEVQRQKQKVDKEFLPLFFASCPEGLEDLLIEELVSFKLEPKRTSKGGAYFLCPHEVGLHFLLCTRIASRVYLKVHQFTIDTEKDVYEMTKKFDWETVLNVNQNFKIQTKLTRSIDNLRKSKFNSNIYLSQVLKDSIVDFFNDKFQRRPNVEKGNADVQIMMHVFPENKVSSTNERVDIYIDLTGNPLTNRGYRLERFAAPLRENLAAGLAKFMQNSVEADSDKKNHLIDLMTGSGTLVIEYAYLMADIAPTYLYLKDYFESEKNLPWLYTKQIFFKKNPKLRADMDKIAEELYLKSKNNFKKLAFIELVAVDLSNKSLSIAKECFQNAEIFEYVQVIKKDATQFTMPGFEGFLFANPPYGERMGEIEKLDDLYFEVGENLKKNFKNCSGFIIASNRELVKKIALKTARKIPVYNGELECRFVRYDLF